MMRLSGLAHRAKKGAGLVAALGGVLVSSSSCYMNDVGPPNASIELSATYQSGQPSNGVCTVLPVLLGSRVENEVSFEGGFRAKVYGSSKGAEITFSGVRDAAELDRFINVKSLRLGYTTALGVVTTDGRPFTVFITGGCEE